MSVYRRNYKIKGKSGTSRFYTVEFTDPEGKLIRKSTKCTTKRAAEAMELQLRQEAEQGYAGITDSSQAKRPLAGVIDEFIDHLEVSLKRDTDYCRIAGHRLRRLMDECGWRRLRDITVQSFENWRSGATKIKAKTVNQYLDIARRFCGWAKKQGKLSRNPLIEVEKAVVIDNPTYRRSATPEELQKLLASVSEERARFYLFVIYTPLRRDTLEALTWGDLHLNDAKPWIQIRGETSKSRRAERSPLRMSLAEALRKVCGKSDELVFPNPPTIDDLRNDLAAAGIPFDDGKGGRRLDLHAFRRTAIKLMKQAGVPLEEAAAILHHKDIRTTRKYYDDAIDPVSVDAVERMPELKTKEMS